MLTVPRTEGRSAAVPSSPAVRVPAPDRTVTTRPSSVARRSPRRPASRSWAGSARAGSRCCATEATASSRRSSAATSRWVSRAETTTATTTATATVPAAAARATRLRSDHRRSAIPAVLEREADAADGVHEPRDVVGLELAAQLADEDVAHVGVEGEVLPPHQFQQPLPAQHETGVAGEDLEQVEFAPGELHRRAVHGGAAAGRVDGERPDGQHAGRRG